MQSVDFHCYITDDMSTDNSADVVEGLIDGDTRFTLIRNVEKWYQPGNYWQILQIDEIDDEDICVTVDGDDWLPHETVFNNVMKYYEDPNIWVTCGQFLEFKGNNKYTTGFTARPSTFDNLRKRPWRSSHMRTFKAWLFREIKKDDLKAPNGEFWEVTGDLSFMYPMLEMAGGDRVHYTKDINYIYNVETDLNDFKVNLSKQLQYANLIRAKNSYDYLTEHK
jgi:glycosyltransferase involved in cell wall biosynthesis